MFERFRQIEENEFHEGAGLGLSIAKGLVELLDGEIWFESEVGKGSTFFVSFPYEPEEPSEAKKPKDESIRLSLENRTIIVAEDDLSSFIYLKEILNGSKADIHHASNGQELMDMLEVNKPDLVLLDISMPVKSGFECLQEMKERGLKLKIIAQTAYAMSDERDRCVNEGCSSYISKPFNKRDLFKTIRTVLES